MTFALTTFGWPTFACSGCVRFQVVPRDVLQGLGLPYVHVSVTCDHWTWGSETAEVMRLRTAMYEVLALEGCDRDKNQECLPPAGKAKNSNVHKTQKGI